MTAVDVHEWLGGAYSAIRESRSAPHRDQRPLAATVQGSTM
jgi:hypothetical protein